MNKELIINTYEENNLLWKENLLGTLENNILKYANETDNFEINLEKNIFRKENLESILEISEKKAFITLKEVEKSFEISLNKHLFIKEGNKIILEYLLESQEKPLKIEIEMSDTYESYNK